MEQLTPGEWATEQVKRAPSFAIAAAIITGLLIISTFIKYAPALPRPELSLTEAEITEEEDVIEDIDKLINPEKPELKPDADAPVVDDDVVPVEAPLDDVTVDVEFTEDPMSDEAEPKDPFPMDLKKMATIGTDPGTGGFRGALGSRSRGGRKRAARKFGMPKDTDKWIIAALRWLKKVQEPDGSWSASKWAGAGNCDAAVSGLALLAFLGFGCTDKYPSEFKLTVKKAVTYLVRKQNNGGFGERMYTQGICTMALAEAHGMGVGGSKVRAAAQAGIDFICRVQGSSGGFGYDGGGSDTSVTGFNFQAIKAGLTAKLKVPSSALTKAEAYLQASLNSDGSSPYGVPNPSGTLPMTAAMLTGRLFLGHSATAEDCIRQAKWLTNGNQHAQVGQAVNHLYSTYYLSLSMFQMGGKYWTSWRDAFVMPLRGKQEKSGPNKGSWPNAGFAYGGHGGRVYTTTMAVLSLEVAWRYQRTSRRR